VVSQKWWSGGGTAAVSSPNFFSRGLGWCGWSIEASKNFERSSSCRRPHHLAGWSGGGAAAVSSPNFFSRGFGWWGWGVGVRKTSNAPRAATDPTTLATISRCRLQLPMSEGLCSAEAPVWVCERSLEGESSQTFKSARGMDGPQRTSGGTALHSPERPSQAASPVTTPTAVEQK
jgi:hypothetical protein